MYDWTIDGMLRAGFSKKMADYLHGLWKQEKESGLWAEEDLEWAHARGFLAESAVAYNLKEAEHIEDYLSDYEYYRIWPLNSWERIWINDKLTLKYMLAGTKYDRYMPKYFYYKTEDRLMPLMDCPEDCRHSSADAVALLVEREKKVACKPCNGALSVGFFELSYENETFYINGEACGKEELKSFVEKHPNYIYTEYFVPSTQLGGVFPLIHTIRVLAIKDGEEKSKIAGGYLRFGTKDSGHANYMNSNSATVFAYDVKIDTESGRFSEGKAVYIDRIEDMPYHPDTNVLVEGTIDLWEEARDMVIGITEYLGLCEYMGFDICFTNKGVKIMEINSHSGIKHLQMRKPLLEEEWCRTYFTKKIEALGRLTSEEITKRNQLMR